MVTNIFFNYSSNSRKQNIQTLLLSAKFIALIICRVTFNMAYAHESWIQPEKFALKAGDKAVANLMVGEVLKGEVQAFNDYDFRHFEIHQNGKKTDVDSRLGDIPALNQTIDNDGLLIIKYESRRSTIDYDDNWEKFVTFLKKHHLESIIEQHKTRNLEQTGVKETYIRYSKSLMKVGTGTGNDEYTGMPFEWILNNNPYTDDGDISMTLLADGKSYPGALVHIFVKEASGIKESTLTTDSKGNILIPRRPGFFLINAVKMQIPPKKVQRSTEAVWESLWASHTFTIDAS